MIRRPSKPALTGLASLVVLALTFGLAGCGGEPGVVKAGGKVTYKGQPVPSGTVYFTPETPGKRGAQGTIDSGGTFTLGTYSTSDGAYTGKHKVTVVAQGPDKPIPPKMKGKMMPEDMQGTGDPLVPKKYFSANTSDLSAEVTDGGKNYFEFELKD